MPCSTAAPRTTAGLSPTANIISNGDISWGGTSGDAGGVATDQQGVGTLYQYWFPCCGGDYTDFFQVNGIGRTFGLLQASGGLPTPDPQWPFVGGANFAVNPVNGQDVVISSSVGRIFATTNEGVTLVRHWRPRGLWQPGTFSVALAYGAPDPSAPEGVGNLGNFIYVGTGTGQIYVTQDGGGSGTSNNWINISTGLDGAAVKSIITDPTRGSHEAYAVTTTGVFFMANSIPSATNPTPTWVNITGNIHNLAYTIFGQAYNPTTDPNAIKLNQAVSLSSIIADWRYAIPVDPSDPSKGYYPVLYVGSNSGVYQSVDDGQTWTLFPDTTYGAVTNGGYLPNVSVSDLDMSLGNIDPNTGMPNTAGPYNPNPADQTSQANADPDILVATTYGQGEFAINLGPLILGNAVAVTPTTTGTGSNPLPTVTGPITIGGSSEISAFGNATWITVEDMTDPANPVVIAGFNPADPVPTPNSSNSTNAVGNFAIPFDPASYYMSNGQKTIEVFATDNAGSVGNVVTYTFNLNDPNLPSPPPPPPSGPPTVTLALAPSAINGSTTGTFTFTGTLANGSTAVTGISSTTGLVTGQTITGTGIPSGTTITVASTNFSGTLTNASNSVTGVTSTTGLFVGETVTGIGIPVGTTIQNIDSPNSTITLSMPATVIYTQPQNLTAVAVTLSAPATASGTSTTITVTSPVTISVTNQTTPTFNGTVTAGATAEVYEYEYDTATNAYDILLASFAPTIAPSGSFSFSFINPPPILENGFFEVFAVASYSKYPLIAAATSNLVYMQIDNTTPNAVTDFRLNPASDTGIVGDNIISGRTPFFIGTAPAGDTVELLESGSSTVYAKVVAGAMMNDLNGNPYDFSIQLPLVLNNGQITLQVIVVDAFSGNPSPLSNPVTMTIVSIASDYNGDSYSDAALYVPSTTSAGQWLAKTTTQVPTTFLGTLTIGSPSVTGITSTTGLVVGQTIAGTGVPTGTTILAINSATAITLSANATVNGAQYLTVPAPAPNLVPLWHGLPDRRPVPATPRPQCRRRSVPGRLQRRRLDRSGVLRPRQRDLVHGRVEATDIHDVPVGNGELERSGGRLLRRQSESAGRGRGLHLRQWPGDMAHQHGKRRCSHRGVPANRPGG